MAVRTALFAFGIAALLAAVAVSGVHVSTSTRAHGRLQRMQQQHRQRQAALVPMEMEIVMETDDEAEQVEAEEIRTDVDADADAETETDAVAVARVARVQFNSCAARKQADCAACFSAGAPDKGDLVVTKGTPPPLCEYDFSSGVCRNKGSGPFGYALGLAGDKSECAPPKVVKVDCKTFTGAGCSACVTAAARCLWRQYWVFDGTGPLVPGTGHKYGVSGCIDGDETFDSALDSKTCPGTTYTPVPAQPPIDTFITSFGLDALPQEPTDAHLTVWDGTRKFTPKRPGTGTPDTEHALAEYGNKDVLTALRQTVTVLDPKSTTGGTQELAIKLNPHFQQNSPKLKHPYFPTCHVYSTNKLYLAGTCAGPDTHGVKITSPGGVTDLVGTASTHFVAQFRAVVTSTGGTHATYTLDTSLPVDARICKQKRAWDGTSTSDIVGWNCATVISVTTDGSLLKVLPLTDKNVARRGTVGVVPVYMALATLSGWVWNVAAHWPEGAIEVAAPRAPQEALDFKLWWKKGLAAPTPVPLKNLRDSILGRVIWTTAGAVAGVTVEITPKLKILQTTPTATLAYGSQTCTTAMCEVELTDVGHFARFAPVPGVLLKDVFVFLFSPDLTTVNAQGTGPEDMPLAAVANLVYTQADKVSKQYPLHVSWEPSVFVTYRSTWSPAPPTPTTLQAIYIVGLDLLAATTLSRSFEAKLVAIWQSHYAHSPTHFSIAAAAVSPPKDHYLAQAFTKDLLKERAVLQFVGEQTHFWDGISVASSAPARVLIQNVLDRLTHDNCELTIRALVISGVVYGGEYHSARQDRVSHEFLRPMFERVLIATNPLQLTQAQAEELFVFSVRLMIDNAFDTTAHWRVTNFPSDAIHYKTKSVMSSVGPFALAVALQEMANNDAAMTLLAQRYLHSITFVPKV